MKTIHIDDILVSTWGYGQTNVGFYQVVDASKTGKTIWMKRIIHYSTDKNGKKKTYDYKDMYGFVMPKKDKFLEPGTIGVLKKVVKYLDNEDPFVYTSTARSMISGSIATLWSGKPVRESWGY